MSFKNKVVIITGAASGIGAATALRFAGLFAQLALVDRHEENLKKSLECCEGKSNTKHLSIVADLSKSEEVLSVVPTIVAHYGKIDVLINCAGVFSRQSILDINAIKDFDIFVAVNLKAPVILTNQAAPYLIETRGNIVNVASIRSKKPESLSSIYCLTKAGIDMFTKCVASELALKGVRANSVLPGVVGTNIQHSLYKDVNIKEYYDNFDRTLPFGVIKPEEIARVITFLASEESKNISGASYTIDGGICVT